MIRLFGRQAVEYKKQHLLCELNRFKDSDHDVERYNISIKEAEDVVRGREDLIYLDARNDENVHRFWKAWYDRGENKMDKEKFAKEVFGEMFDEVIAWIRKELDPSEVFSEEVLVEWVTSNKKPEEVFSFDGLERLCKHIDRSVD
jgi:hypothetical protein